jgi:predicted DNA repair protein MutK
MTVGVYGLVAGIVKLDDAGLYLVKTSANNAWGGCQRALGNGFLRLAPYLMKMLAVVGTLAMFMVGGGILVHGIPSAYAVLHHAAEAVHGIPRIGGVLAALTPMAVNALAGVVAGGLALAVVSLARGIIGRLRKPA